ncbi:IS630 transposase-related protein [Holospora elegans]|uniref:IS630 transposase-related protein n=1 Tax=Holospora elegans TaxID=431043 RepID=UPI00277D06F3|nr:IS630 transposase-related protein [Holospora elegans]
MQALGGIKASHLFKISVSAIGRWHRKYRQEDRYFPKRRGSSEKNINLEKLEVHVKEPQDTTLKKAAQEFGVQSATG